jgi:hypothetical protein
MASEKDLELLDQYVGNRLNAQEKAAFEQQLQVDAELKNELLFQQRIAGGIRKARAVELKQLLNNIPLSSIPNQGPSLLTQISLSVVVGGLIGAGMYFYFRQDQSAIPSPVIETMEEIKEEKSVPGESVDEQEIKNETPAEPQPEIASPKNNTSPVPKNTTPEKAEEKPVEPSTLDVFDPGEELDATSNVSEEENKTGTSSSPSIIVETLTDKRYNFHYQFKDNKLYLYGSFEKNLYEIMEFFSDNKRTMFLFYKDNYYLLNEENEKVRALAPIKDEILLKKLKDYRGN